MRWEYGRRKTGYRLLKLFSSWSLRMDCYLLHYPPGSYIDTHTDPAIDGYEHHRINITLIPAKKGGFFYLEMPSGYKYIVKNQFYNRFRPDDRPHGVTEIKEGNRYVLSIGWLRKMP